MTEFMKSGPVPIDRLEIGSRRWDLHEIARRVVVGARTADAEIRTGSGNQRLGSGLNLAWWRWDDRSTDLLGQAIALVGVEDGKALEKRDGARLLAGGSFTSVTDPTGAVIPNVRVVATEVRTGVKTPTTTDTAGQYNIPFLPPGQYEVSADAPGFRPFVRKGLTLGASNHAVVDLQMAVGQASQAVEVTAEPDSGS